MTPKKKIVFSIASAIGLVGVAMAAPVAEGGRKYVEALTGQAEIDAGALNADMDGSGTAHVTVNVGQGRVCWNLTDLANLDTITAAHIHEAPSTAAGASSAYAVSGMPSGASTRPDTTSHQGSPRSLATASPNSANPRLL